MSHSSTSDEYDHGFEDGFKQGRKVPQRFNKKKALRIVRLLIKHYSWGDSNDTLAYVLQNEMEKEK